MLWWSGRRPVLCPWRKCTPGTGHRPAARHLLFSGMDFFWQDGGSLFGAGQDPLGGAGVAGRGDQTLRSGVGLSVAGRTWRGWRSGETPVLSSDSPLRKKAATEDCQAAASGPRRQLCGEQR